MVRVVVASAEGGSGAVKRPWLGAKLQEVTPDIADSLGLKRPSGALVASVAADSPAGARRHQDRRSHRQRRRHRGRRSERLRLSLRHQAAGRHGAARRDPAGPGDCRAGRPAEPARHAARGARDHAPLAVPRRHGGQSVAGSGRRAAARSAGRGRRRHRGGRRLGRRNRSASRRATSSFRSTIRRSPNPPTSSASPVPAAGNGGSPSCAAASRSP